MKKNCKIFSFIALLLVFAACQTKQKPVAQTQVEQSNVQEKLERTNRFLSQKDKDKIEAFLRRNKINATFDKNGFWKLIIEKGDGEKIKDGMVVALTGNVALIDGTPCYTYTAEKPLVFVVDKSEAISGLHLAMQTMCLGERAVLVFPPHLAHGILGDSDQIPPRSIVVYDVKVIDKK